MSNCTQTHHDLVPIVINALMSGGESESALECFGQLAKHLRGLTAAYPNTEEFWRNVLSHGPPSAEDYLVIVHLAQ